MADNYTLFSECIGPLTDEQLNWIRERFASSEKIKEEDNDWYDRPEVMDFDLRLSKEERTCHFYSEDSGAPDGAARFIQDLLARFFPDCYFELQVAWTCSRPRPGEFGGQTLLITKDDVEPICSGCRADVHAGLGLTDLHEHLGSLSASTVGAEAGELDIAPSIV